jgi:hypothetical protein
MSVTLNASTSSGFVSTADTSGTVEIQSNGTTKLTVASTGVSGTLVSGTVVASTSGTSISFTGIPSWAKRITVMLNEVSLSGTSNLLIQIGSGSTTSSGYISTGNSTSQASTTQGGNSTAGFIVWSNSLAAIAVSGIVTVANITGNTWVESHSTKIATTTAGFGGGISPALGGALDRVVITTVNGTDTFDAGSINIQYEG